MSDLHALLIGVDRHEPNRGPDSFCFWDLRGATNDALRMERFLREGPPAVSARRIRTLVSPGLFSDVPIPPPEDLPTYVNIVGAIRDLMRRVGEGDQVLIQFSGHGARIPSKAPIKGRDGMDEAIVPCDGAHPDGGVLRDVEIYRLLQELSATGAYVTLILDSCYAGGALRGPREEGARVRGLGRRTGVWGPHESAVGPWQELYGALAAAEHAGQRPGFRHAKARSGWFPQPERCVLLAACRGPERALEDRFGGRGPSGAFTHFLLEELGRDGAEGSYETVQRWTRDQLRSSGVVQIPILEGEGELGFLQAGRRPSPPRPEVGRTEEGGDHHPEHGRRFAEIRGLATPPGSSLAGGLELELCRLRRKEDWHVPALRLPIRGDTVRIGELLCLLVRNRSDQTLNFVVLDLRSDGGVERVHPKKDEGEVAVIEAGQECPVYLGTWLPHELSEAESRLKVLASVDWLDAAAYELPLPGSRAEGVPPWPARLPVLPEDGWAVAEVGISVVR